VITGATQIAAVIGWPVTHSRSPQMFAAAFAASGIDAAMIPIGVPPEKLADAIAGLRAMRVLGASVTAPHKLAVHALCDELSDAARTIGAVNCLQLLGDKLVGHNTDSDGFIDGLRATGCVPGHAVILGAGGAARAVAYGLLDREIVARRDASWTQTTPWSELAAAFARADLVVDCTSMALGQPRHDDESHLLPLEHLRPHAWVASLVYHHQPPLLVRAASLGHPILDGRAMLVHQGARAFHIWTGRDAPVDAMRDALDASLNLS
jgi:shikimate dehydrogenase